MTGLNKQHFDPQLMIANSGLSRGDTLLLPGSTHLADAVKRLWNEKFFSDIQIYMEFIDHEKVNIESVGKFWNFLRHTIENAPEK